MSQFQASANASAMYLTGGAQNLLCIKLAQELGVIIPNVWATWFKLAALPGLIGLLVTPLLLFTLYPPELKDTPEAPGLAEVKLKEMGPVTPNELIMVGTMLLAVSLWVLGDSIGIPSVVAAMIALCVLLLSGVLSWNDCLAEKSAWDTLAWFAVLIGMSAQLNAMGIVQWMADNVAAGLTGAGGAWVGNFFKLQVGGSLLVFLSLCLNAMGIMHWAAAGLTGAGGAWVGNFFKLQALGVAATAAGLGSFGVLGAETAGDSASGGGGSTNAGEAGRPSISTTIGDRPRFSARDGRSASKLLRALRCDRRGNIEGSNVRADWRKPRCPSKALPPEPPTPSLPLPLPLTSAGDNNGDEYDRVACSAQAPPRILSADGEDPAEACADAHSSGGRGSAAADAPRLKSPVRRESSTPECGSAAALALRVSALCCA
ncbi:unnamed protein product [Closterium sp. NIES-53]